MATMMAVLEPVIGLSWVWRLLVEALVGEQVADLLDSLGCVSASFCATSLSGWPGCYGGALVGGAATDGKVIRGCAWA